MRYRIEDFHGRALGGAFRGTFTQAKAKAQRFANDETHNVKLYKIDRLGRVIDLVASFTPATKSNPSSPSLGKWQPVKAVRFNANGSVSLRVGAKRNPAKKETIWKISAGSKWGTVKAPTAKAARQLAKKYGWAGKFEVKKSIPW
jgi:hypothetical protein